MPTSTASDLREELARLFFSDLRGLTLGLLWIRYKLSYIFPFFLIDMRVGPRSPIRSRGPKWSPALAADPRPLPPLLDDKESGSMKS